MGTPTHSTVIGRNYIYLSECVLGIFPRKVVWAGVYTFIGVVGNIDIRCTTATPNASHRGLSRYAGNLLVALAHA